MEPTAAEAHTQGTTSGRSRPRVLVVGIALRWGARTARVSAPGLAEPLLARIRKVAPA